ncbi:MAG TPA: hypothetical protein VG013_27765 [Gemmataceae bacterium]|nr:hypothetical protein [Gemmataceae bacterium]
MIIVILDMVHGAAGTAGENAMMGPAKLSTIRAEVRKAFKVPDADLIAWFNRQLDELGQKPKANRAESDTLQLLRDALVKEAKRVAPRRRPPRVPGRSKS